MPRAPRAGRSAGHRALMRFRAGAATAVLVSAVLVSAGVLVPVPEVAPAYAAGETTVIQRKVIGHSVQGRPIVALRLGEPDRPVVVLMAAMHGNEAAPTRILRSLAAGPAIHGLDLWVVPTYNPDGVAAHRRQNAHGVDLNRNFPYHWIRQTGTYDSGPKAGSEPETKAVMRFLRRVKPTRIISFHQPLYGVDTDTKDPAFARRLARALKLPSKAFVCGGVCHGTMTGWYNHRFAGSAVTVEYDAHPPGVRLRKKAPRQLLRVLGGWRGDPVASG